MTDPQPRRPIPWTLIAVWVVFDVLIFTGGILYYRSVVGQVRRSAHENLAAIEDLKIRQVVSWRQERFSDANFVLNSEPIALQLVDLERGINKKEVTSESVGWMISMYKNGQYERIRMLDGKGRLLLSVPDSTGRPLAAEQAAIDRAGNSKIVESTPFFRSDSSAVFLDLVVPVFNRERGISVRGGSVILQIDPTRTLYPLVQSWPLPSETAECFLVDRQGSDAVVLSPLRYNHLPPTEMHVPPSDSLRPAAIALRGSGGIVEGRDDRGQRVLVAAKKIPNSPWYLVAKIDEDEVYASTGTTAWLTNALVIVLMGAAGLALGFWWRHQREEFYRHQLRIEREKQVLARHLHNLTKYANDIILTTDGNFNIVEANDRAVASYGYRREELLKMKLADLSTTGAPFDPAAFMAQTTRADGPLFESKQRRKDGSEFPIEYSARMIDIEGNQFVQNIVRDITERKSMEEILRTSEEFHRALLEALPDPVTVVDLEGKITFYTPNTLEMFGAPSDLDVRGANLLNWIHPDDHTRASDGIMRVRASGVGHATEYKLVRYDKSVFWAEISSELLRDPSGQPNAILSILRDVSQRRRDQWQQRMLSQAVKSVSECVSVTDHNNTILFVNESFLKTYGYIRDELIGRNIAMVRVEDPSDSVDRVLHSTQHGGWQGELLNRRKDGTEFPIYLSTSEVRDERGEVIALIGVAEDITERKRREQDLRHSETRYRSLFESAQDAIMLFRNDRLVDCNPGALKLLGAARDTMIGITPSALDPSDMPATESSFAAILHAAAKGVPQSSECRMCRLDGSEFDAEVSLRSIQIEQQTMILAIVRDVTERRRNLEQLRLQNAALQSAANAIVITDRSGAITWANAAFERMTGYALEEVIGQNPKILKSGKEPESFYRDLWTTILQGRPWFGELVNRRKDGTTYNEEQTVTPVRDAGGAITHFIAIKQDVTNRKSLQAQLFQAQKMEGIGTLAGGIAHDFNNILGIILGYASMLERSSVSPPDIQKSVSAISRAVDRGSNLVKQILTFARKTETVRGLMDLRTITKEFTKMAVETFPRKIQISAELADEIPPILGDPTQIHQAFLNICINARDAMPDGGTITLRVNAVPLHAVRTFFPEASASGFVCVRIGDTGSGMDAVTRARIFEPFFSTKEVGKGTGLGLAVVYGVMQSHKGFVRVESEPDHGTEFFLYFPVVPKAHASEMGRSDAPRETPGGSETILVVEDEDMMRSVLKGNLEAKGYRILTAVDGHEAVELYRKRWNEIQLVLSDLGLPKMGGDEAFRQMKKINPRLKLILMTGFLETEVKAQLTREGVVDIVMKPFDTPNLFMKLRKALDLTAQPSP